MKKSGINSTTAVVGAILGAICGLGLAVVITPEIPGAPKILSYAFFGAIVGAFLLGLIGAFLSKDDPQEPLSAEDETGAGPTYKAISHDETE